MIAPQPSARKRLARFTASAALAALAGSPGALLAQDGAQADLILTDAKIYTVDPARPWAEAVAVRDGRILAVGSAAEIAKKRGPQTKVVDLHGQFLMPAFGDAHIHPEFGGMSYSRCSLHGGKTLNDYRAIIAKCIADTPGNSTIFGIGWQDALFPPNGIPTKDILDALSSTRPLIFQNEGGHSLWVNSRALELAGITKDTPDPKTGKIDRDPATGEPNGGLQEGAMGLVHSLVPPPSAQDLQDAIVYTATRMHALGIATWHDALVEWGADGSSPVLDAYKSVIDAGKLNMHVVMDLLWKNDQGTEQLPGMFRASARAESMGLAAHGTKFLIDGVIPQHTAFMKQPYTDAPDTTGAPHVAPDVLAAAVTEIDAHGMQVHFHTIGDGAVHEALDAVAAARKAHGMTDMRPMISHMNVIDPVDQPRFGKLGVTAIFQPLWACNEPYMLLTKKVVGPERSQWIYPEASVAKGGGRIAYGSDWPVASANPLEGIETAITRVGPGTDMPPLLPAEGVSRASAVRSYTLEVAYVNHMDTLTGSIVAGKSADFVVLDRNLITIPVQQIHQTRVLMTVFAGKPVYGGVAGLGKAQETPAP